MRRPQAKALINLFSNRGLIIAIGLLGGLLHGAQAGDTDVPARPLPAVLTAAPTVSPVATQMPALRSFQDWLAGFTALARDAGISQATLDQALADLEPDPRLLALDRRQSEYHQTFFGYLHNQITDRRIARGRALLLMHADLLAGLEAQYGVPGPVLVALWGMETDFGGHLGDFAVLRALATLAHAGRRRDFFEGQLLAALTLLEQGRVSTEQLRGSWAGAMGQTQFMPTTFRDHAVDADGDGRADLWGSVADALASAANYLAALGWQRDGRWGREVRLPAGFDYHDARLSLVLPLADWQARGVTMADGAPLPTGADVDEGEDAGEGEGKGGGALILPAGKDGPAFLVDANFHIITGWNRSLHFALAVAHLADRLAGAAPLVGAPPADDAPLRRSEILAMQDHLNALGYACGSADGMVGRQTRHALRDWQRDRGLPADAWPTPAVIARLAVEAGQLAGAVPPPTR